MIWNSFCVYYHINIENIKYKFIYWLAKQIDWYRKYMLCGVHHHLLPTTYICTNFVYSSWSVVAGYKNQNHLLCFNLFVALHTKTHYCELRDLFLLLIYSVFFVLIHLLCLFTLSHCTLLLNSLYSILCVHVRVFHLHSSPTHPHSNTHTCV